MSRAVIPFALGVLVFHQVRELPGWGIWLVMAVVVLLLGVPRRGRVLLLAPAGFAWAHLLALSAHPAALPVDTGPKKLMVRGHVDSLVQRSGPSSRFVFAIDNIDTAAYARSGTWRVRLTWREAPHLKPGDRLSLTVRIRPAHGFAVPGGWDYEGWLYRQGVRYTGYVVEGRSAGLISDSCCLIDRARARLGDAIDDVKASAFARGVLRALVIGDKSAMSTDARRLFRDTGTSHLMAISGLHIGLVAGLGFWVFTAVWRRVPLLAARLPAPVAGAALGLLLGVGYAMLAGLSLPTQRALVMLGVMALGVWLRRESKPSAVLALAAAGVLLWDPSSILAAGFWLSFGAVAAILAILALAPREPRWRSLVRIQIAISVALWPVLALFGLPASGVAPLVNLVLVPLFSFLVVPVSLLGAAILAIVPDAGAWILTHLAGLLNLLREILSAVAGSGLSLAAADVNGKLAALIALAAVAILLLPHGFPFRSMALPLMAVIWLPRAPVLEPGDFNVHVLDVGQGLSTVIETRHHSLVFDTGPQYPSGFSTVEAVVMPFLAHRGLSSVDGLVLSHGDNDHAGGADRLLEAIRIGFVRSGEPARVSIDAVACRSGESWQWDGVTFMFLHPDPEVAQSGNNASCVLRIANARSSVLFTGDIEALVERSLIRSSFDKLDVDLVVAPHHGSRSSSTDAFVAATAPAYVVYTTGWANRYGFPADEVRDRWSASGAAGIDTAAAGTISFLVDASHGIRPPTCYRIHARRFWWHNGGTADACHAVSSPD